MLSKTKEEAGLDLDDNGGLNFVEDEVDFDWTLDASFKLVCLDCGVDLDAAGVTYFISSKCVLAFFPSLNCVRFVALPMKATSNKDPKRFDHPQIIRKPSKPFFETTLWGRLCCKSDWPQLQIAIWN